MENRNIFICSVIDVLYIKKGVLKTLYIPPTIKDSFDHNFIA